MSDPFTQMLAQMMEQGQKMAAAYTHPMNPMAGQFSGGIDMAALAQMFPTLPREVAEAWFGKTHNPEGLDARTRTLVVLTGLIVQGTAGEALVRPTIAQALAAGASKREITEVILQTALFGVLPSMQKALETAQAVFDKTEESQA